jgi:hypothetical protein
MPDRHGGPEGRGGRTLPLSKDQEAADNQGNREEEEDMSISSTAPAISAATAAARRRVLRDFREAGAHSAPSAIGFEPRRRLDRRYFNSLVDFGALVEAKPGTYYLDEEKLREHTAKRRKRAFTILATMLVLGAAAFGASQL